MTPETVACQAPLSMGCSRQECWSGLPCPPPGDLHDPGTEHRCPTLRWILYHLTHQGSPRILECVADPFSWNFPTQGLNQGLPHCRRILYQLSHQGSPSPPIPPSESLSGWDSALGRASTRRERGTQASAGGRPSPGLSGPLLLLSSPPSLLWGPQVCCTASLFFAFH